MQLPDGRCLGVVLPTPIAYSHTLILARSPGLHSFLVLAAVGTRRYISLLEFQNPHVLRLFLPSFGQAVKRREADKVAANVAEEKAFLQRRVDDAEERSRDLYAERLDYQQVTRDVFQPRSRSD